MSVWLAFVLGLGVGSLLTAIAFVLFPTLLPRGSVRAARFHVMSGKPELKT